MNRTEKMNKIDKVYKTLIIAICAIIIIGSILEIMHILNKDSWLHVVLSASIFTGFYGDYRIKNLKDEIKKLKQAKNNT